MIQDVKFYIEPYVTFDNPIPYKDNLQIYPFKVKDFYNFSNCIDIFEIDKNKIPDVDVIQMNYLQFIVRKLFSNEEKIDDMKYKDIWKIKFYTLLSLIFNVEMDKIFIKEDNQKHLFVDVDGTLIDNKEFDEIIKIVMFQNYHDYDDTEMSEDFKRVVTEYYSLKFKNITPLTLEDKIDVVTSKMRYSLDYVYNLTYRRFSRLFEKIIDEIDYIVGCNGYTREKPPEHWVYKTSKGKYDDVFIDAESFENKIHGVNG